MHTDNASSPGSDAIVSSALVPRSADRLGASDADLAGRPQQLLLRLDRVEHEQARLHDRPRCRRERPSRDGSDRLRGRASTGVKLNGGSIATTTRTIKGRQYAFFDAAPGSYEATYAVDDTGPAISNVAHAVSGDGTATITWDTDEISDSRVDFGTDPDSLTATVRVGSTLVTSHSVQLTGLSPSTTYHYASPRRMPRPTRAPTPRRRLAPRTFTTPDQGFTDTTVADFTAGSPDADTRMSGRPATAS